MITKKMTYIVIFCCVTLSGLCMASQDGTTVGLAEEGLLRIHLAREVTIKDSLLELGEVGAIMGGEQLAARARVIGLGRVSVPGQKLVINRAVILSRLACNGIPAQMVKLTGAETVTVSKEQRIITGQELVEAGQSFLKINPPAGSVCTVEVVRMPLDLVLPGPTEDVTLTAAPAKSEVKGQARVRVAITDRGKEIAAREITFRLKYQCHRVVSLSDIPVGAVISPENVKIETIVCEHPGPANWKPPYGLVAKRQLPASIVVLEDMVEPVKPDVVVKRSEMVMMRIECPGLVVTAAGTAMQDARTGEYVKVRNVDSQRIVLCKVNGDGTVEPVM